MPDWTAVPPVYVLLAERITRPLPASVTLLPTALSLIGPEIVKLLPAVVLTMTLLPSTTGAAIVWFPPLLVTLPVSIRVLVVSPAEQAMV